MRTLLAGALALLMTAPASAQIRKFQDWIAACDNQRNCVAYSWNRDSYHAYLRIQRDGAPSADARLTLAISGGKPITFRVEAAADPGLFRPGPISELPVDNDGHIRLSVEAPAAKITAWVRKTQKLLIYQLEPPPSDPNDTLDGIPLTGAVAALAWIDERQLRSGSETAFVKRGKKSVALLPPQPALPVVAAAKPGKEPVPAQQPPEIAARANATCGKESIDATHVKTVRLAAGQLMHWFFCGQYSGAAGLNHTFLLMPDGKARAAAKPRFVLPPVVARHIRSDGKIPKNKDAVFNPEFDPATLTLTSFSIWRGCGEIVKWVWTGREFQVAEFSAMPKCEDLPPSDWPVLYSAQVK